MQINVNWDPSVSNAPAGFRDAINYVVNLFDTAFTNPITINIEVGWAEIAGRELSSGALGESGMASTAVYSYSSLRTALVDNANTSKNPLQLTAVASLPAADPTKAGSIDIGPAQAKALGLLTNGGAELDGYVGFNGAVSWSFSPSAIPAANAFDFIGVAEHEISELMGRISDVGMGYYSAMDLFRYSAPSARDLSPGQPGSIAYFSIDNGNTDLGNWNNTLENGDLGDWYPEGPGTGGDDAFNDISHPGVLNRLSAADLTLLNVLGWNEVSCFMAGTRIRTPAGENAIENLRPGELVMLADGRVAPVRWIGRRTVLRRFADPLRVLPVRIAAAALGEDVPCRDLLLSPDHAILMGETLIHAGALVNDCSITREHDVPESFTYYHLELDEHSLILANNTPAETFIANVNRFAFENWQEHQKLYPDGKLVIEMAYPRAKSHRQIPRILRQCLAERAARLYATRSAAVMASSV